MRQMKDDRIIIDDPPIEEVYEPNPTPIYLPQEDSVNKKSDISAYIILAAIITVVVFLIIYLT